MTSKQQWLSITVILLSALSLSFAVSAVRASAISKVIPPKCPVISVSCPATDQPFRFTAAVYDADSREKISNLNVEYCWVLSKGRILYGQGTDAITVDASSTDMRGITATVDVRGLIASVRPRHHVRHLRIEVSFCGAHNKPLQLTARKHVSQVILISAA